MVPCVTPRHSSQTVPASEVRPAPPRERPPTVRVLISDEASFIRRSLRSVLQACADIDVVAETADCRETVAAARALEPDVVLTDISAPPPECGLPELQRLPRPPAVVVLTTGARLDSVDEALAAGAVGFLLKDAPPRELVAAVRKVAQGHGVLAPEVTRRVIDTALRCPPGVTPDQRRRLGRLTRREHEVLALLGAGLPNSRIGEALGMSEGTTKGHVSRLMAKLRAENRVQAALLAQRAGIAADTPGRE